MKTISQNAVCELDIKKSCFLAEAFPVSSQEEARELLKKQKERHFDATHVVHAFVIGSSGEILGCSDDGEPSGTAGRPSLDVLKGSGATNILVTVSRWFGGTLLGTGGLVKAYGDSVKAVLDICELHEIIETRSFILSLPYALYERYKRDADSLGITESVDSFSSDVEITGSVRIETASALQEYVRNASAGKIEVVFQ